MCLSLSFFVAYLASTAATQVAAADTPELELHDHSPKISNGDESMLLPANPETWNQIIDIPQTPMQGDDFESSDHDPECIGIHTLVPVLNGATCTGILLREQINVHATDGDSSPVPGSETHLQILRTESHRLLSASCKLSLFRQV